MRRGTQNRHGENLGEFVRASLHPCRGGYQPPETPRGRVLQMNVYLTGQTPSLLLLEKVPAGGCGGDTLRNFRAEIDVSASNSTFRFCVLTHSGTCYRCPLHIRRLRAAPSPAGEGFLASDRGFTNSPGVSHFASLYRPSSTASGPPSPLGKVMGFHPGVYVRPTAQFRYVSGGW